MFRRVKLRSLRRYVVALIAVSFALTAGTGMAAADQPGAAAWTTNGIQGSGVTAFVEGAPIRCDLSAGDGIRVNGPRVEVTFAVACRWTDDEQLARDVSIIDMRAGIIRGSDTLVAPLTQCADNRPFLTCPGVSVRNWLTARNSFRLQSRQSISVTSG